MHRIITLTVLLVLLSSVVVKAQIGDYRNDLAIGVNGGYVMSNVGFTPSVTQKMHGGLTGGFTVRYTCEKYFKSICAIVGEVNISQMGWKEDIRTSLVQLAGEATFGNIELEHCMAGWQSHLVNISYVP